MPATRSSSMQYLSIWYVEDIWVEYRSMPCVHLGKMCVCIAVALQFSPKQMFNFLFPPVIQLLSRCRFAGSVVTDIWRPVFPRVSISCLPEPVQPDTGVGITSKFPLRLCVRTISNIMKLYSIYSSKNMVWGLVRQGIIKGMVNAIWKRG